MSNLYELIKKIKYVGFSLRLVKNFAMYIQQILPLLAQAFKLTKVEYLSTLMKENLTSDGATYKHHPRHKLDIYTLFGAAVNMSQMFRIFPHER